jgi:hypothetical protein
MNVLTVVSPKRETKKKEKRIKKLIHKPQDGASDSRFDALGNRERRLSIINLRAAELDQEIGEY